MTSERRRTALVLLIGAGVVAVDQLTKTIAVNQLSFGEPVHLFWTLQLNLVYNPGGAFSIGAAYTPYLAAAAAAVLAVLLLSSRRAMSPGSASGLGFVIGGAAGNLTDRLVRDNGGAVIDFFDLQWWPVFNVADIALWIGAGLLIITALLEERRRDDDEQPAVSDRHLDVPEPHAPSTPGDG